MVTVSGYGNSDSNILPTTLLLLETTYHSRHRNSTVTTSRLFRMSFMMCVRLHAPRQRERERVSESALPKLAPTRPPTRRLVARASAYDPPGFPLRSTCARTVANFGRLALVRGVRGDRGTPRGAASAACRQPTQLLVHYFRRRVERSRPVIDGHLFFTLQM